MILLRDMLGSCRGSEITGGERLQRLGVIYERFHTTPQKLGRMRRKEAKDLLLDMVTEMEKAGLSANYIRNFGKAAKS